MLPETDVLPLPGNPRHVLATDLDHDGLQDLVSSNFDRSSVSVFLGAGLDERFAASHRLRSSITTWWFSVPARGGWSPPTSRRR